MIAFWRRLCWQDQGFLVVSRTERETAEAGASSQSAALSSPSFHCRGHSGFFFLFVQSQDVFIQSSAHLDSHRSSCFSAFTFLFLSSVHTGGIHFSRQLLLATFSLIFLSLLVYGELFSCNHISLSIYRLQNVQYSRFGLPTFPGDLASFPGGTNSLTSGSGVSGFVFRNVSRLGKKGREGDCREFSE